MKINIIDQFPEDFMFGASTSSFQVEGAADKDGRGLAIHDLKKKVKGITDFSIASDHYNRFEEDIDLMKELGLNSYRLSLSWVRILPDGKNINEKGLEFYDRLLKKIVDSGIEPIVTIYHFEYPQALIEKYRGWLSKESIDDYENFAKILFKRYGDKVKYWITINEQDHILRFTERLGLDKDIQGIDYERKAQLINYNMCVATARVIKLCHEMIPNSKIGPAINPMTAIPAKADPKDVIAAIEFDELTCNYILDLHCRGKYSPIHWKYLKDRDICPEICENDMKLMRENTPDFIGINYYMNQTIEASVSDKITLHSKELFAPEKEGLYKLAANELIPKTDWGWNICPEGLKISIMNLYNRYQLPMLITENGLGAYDKLEEEEKVHDGYRIEYINNHLKQIKDCVSYGFPILGYCVWSCIDLVSGREGMDKRYGLIFVNRDNEDLKDLKRVKKDSYYWYQKVISERGKNL